MPTAGGQADITLQVHKTGSGQRSYRVIDSTELKTLTDSLLWIWDLELPRTRSLSRKQNEIIESLNHKDNQIPKSLIHKQNQITQPLNHKLKKVIKSLTESAD